MFLNLTLVLGVFSLIAFIAEIKNFKYSKPLMIFCLLLAMADGVLGGFVGTSGGDIRHSEITSTAVFTP